MVVALRPVPTIHRTRDRSIFDTIHAEENEEPRARHCICITLPLYHVIILIIVPIVRFLSAAVAVAAAV